jgi:hypothetical protein
VSIAVAEVLIASVAAYAALGIAFALAFVVRGAGRIDPGAAAGTLGFRILIFPGAAALWPLLAARWRRTSGVPPEQRDAHADAARRRTESLA